MSQVLTKYLWQTVQMHKHTTATRNDKRMAVMKWNVFITKVRLGNVEKGDQRYDNSALFTFSSLVLCSVPPNPHMITKRLKIWWQWCTDTGQFAPPGRRHTKQQNRMPYKIWHTSIGWLYNCHTSDIPSHIICWHIWLQEWNGKKWTAKHKKKYTFKRIFPKWQ